MVETQSFFFSPGIMVNDGLMVSPRSFLSWVGFFGVYSFCLNLCSCDVILPAGKGAGTAIGPAKAWPKRAITVKLFITENILAPLPQKLLTFSHFMTEQA